MHAVPRCHATDDDFAAAIAAAFSGGERHRNTGDLKTIPASDGSLWIECECVQPKSMIGRAVFIRFDPPDVLKMLMECRAAAITGRSKPMQEAQ